MTQIFGKNSENFLMFAKSYENLCNIDEPWTKLETLS